MPGRDDTDNLTEKELAELAEYENSEDMASAKPEPESRAEQLTKLFRQTPEMQELRQLTDTVHNELNAEDDVPLYIHVPRAFIRQTEFLEEKRAAAAGVAPSPAANVLNRILVNALHEELHWLATGPARFSHYRNLWNQFCDEQGAPEEKIGEDGKPAPQERGEEGPF
jgi:hypothetical protein